jgi:hypothetical protein
MAEGDAAVQGLSVQVVLMPPYDTQEYDTGRVLPGFGSMAYAAE